MLTFVTLLPPQRAALFATPESVGHDPWRSGHVRGTLYASVKSLSTLDRRCEGAVNRGVNGTLVNGSSHRLFTPRSQRRLEVRPTL